MLLRLALVFFALGCTVRPLHAQADGVEHWVVQHPSDFATLPAPIRSSLEQRGCTIAQDTSRHRPHNVIRGQFERPGQQDWAVLCMRGQSTQLLIYWESRVARLDSLSVDIPRDHPDIEIADPTYITEHAEFYGWPDSLPRSIVHYGVELGSGCCSHIYYREAGRWILTPGAD